MASRSIDPISKKTKFARAAHFFSNQLAKKQICTCTTLFCLSLPLFCTTTTPFCTTKTSNFTKKLQNIFMVKLSYRYVLTKDFVSCVHVRFYFFTAAHFHLARRQHFSFSHRRYEIFMFFFPRNSSPLFSVTRSSSFSVIHVSVNIKNNVEKDTTLLLFFLSKSPGGHAISYQMKP